MRYGMENIKGLKRTGYCAEYDIKDVGKKAVLMGWVNRSRNLGSIIFCDMRDRTGLIQVVFREEKNKNLFDKATNLKSEYVIAVTGIVNEREDKNPNIKTGDIEIEVEELRILSESAVPAIDIAENTATNELMRLKYRYLDLRKPKQQHYLIMRNNIAKCTRYFFSENGFIEVETPVLTRSTPEGARDYLVPSRVNQGKFYALPQSPQLLKQLLMISGLDRYYQIVKCFRDEDLRADRQPEFTQIDCEMAFVEQEDILNVFEGLTRHLLKEIKGIEVEKFPRITYDYAMKTYGNDKPDIRFDMKFGELNEVAQHKDFPVFNAAELVVGIAAPNCAAYTRKEIDALIDWVKRPQVGASGMVYVKCEADGTYKSSVDKFYDQDDLAKWAAITGAKAGDMIFVLSGPADKTRTQLSALRMELATRLGLRNPAEFAPLWVVDFPLLELDEESGRWHAMHHPFTSPKPEDMELLATNPGKVRANAYDMVLNGNEIGGGSIRIHDKATQQLMFKYLGFTEEEARNQFGFLMDAFQFGAPPHGGLAFGLDRLVAILGGQETIRDFIAFPKNNSGRDVMIDAPSVIDDSQLKELHIKVDLK